MTSRGRVRQYSAKEGWGVIDSADTPGGCLVQVLSTYTPSVALSAWDEVDFEWEPLPLESMRSCSDRPPTSCVQPGLLSSRHR